MYIFSNSIETNRGPGKVINNLIKGFELLNYSYHINDLNFNSESFIYCQDKHNILKTEYITNMIIGPNISILPTENNNIMNQRYKKLLTPSLWVYNLYKKWIDSNKIEIYPTGIDYNTFFDFSTYDKTINCLIYYKNRKIEELNSIIEILNDNNQTFITLEYGKYNEEQFIDTLKQCQYCFLLDNTESQGIAVLEIMSTNTPLFVWDINFWTYNNITVDSTSIPYCDDICGEVVYNYNDIKNKFKMFIINLNNYNPRKYILDNLKLEDQAQKLIDMF
jgi:hypothetical protein